MFETTIKSLLARKLRLLTTGLAVLIGVAFMAGTFVLTDTISSLPAGSSGTFRFKRRIN